LTENAYVNYEHYYKKRKKELQDKFDKQCVRKVAVHVGYGT
jgi:hypothetical protein